MPPVRSPRAARPAARPADPIAFRPVSVHPGTRTARPAMSANALRPRPQALAILLLGGALGFVVPGPAAQAQAVEAAQRVAFDLPAGSLEDALNALARQAGVTLSVDPALLRDRRVPALSGSHTVEDAFAALLQGSGLGAVRQQQGGYVVRPVARPGDSAPAQASTLPAVRVTASAPLEATTEGTQSYTTGESATATRLQLSLRETPQSVSVITRQRIEDQGLTQLSDVVAQTTGLVMSASGNTGTDSSPIYSRGFSVNTYMVDGVRQINSYAGIFQSNDMAMFDRVEIVRGATGLMNGVGSPGGAINLVRKRPTRQFQGSARAELGSWDYVRLEGDVSSPLDAEGRVRGRLVVASQGNRSYIDRLHEERAVLFGTLEADLTPDTLLRGGWSWQYHDATGHARGGLPAYNADGSRAIWSRSDSAAASWAYSSRRYSTLFAALEHRLSQDWRLHATLTRANNFFDEQLGYASGGNPDPATGGGVAIWAGRWTAKPVQDTLDVYVSGTFDLFGRKHDLVLGALASRSRHDSPSYNLWWHDGWDRFIPDIYIWDGRTPDAPFNPPNGRYSEDERLKSAYASLRLRATDALSVILGARVSDWSRREISTSFATATSPASRTDTKRQETGEVTPYAGLVFDFSRDWSAYASYTSIFQSQSARQLDGRYLDPQVGSSQEVGIKGALFDGRLNVSAAAYRVRQDNLAVAIPDVFLPDGSAAYRAESGTRTTGYEAELSGELAPGWQLTAGYNHNRPRDRFGERLSTNVPSSTAKLFTTWRLDALAHGALVGGGVRWQSDIYSDNLGPAQARFVQPSYAVVDLVARYPMSASVTAGFNVYNALDKSYYATTGNSYYGAPRHFRVSLEARF